MSSTEPTCGPMAPVANYSMVEKVVTPSRLRRKMAIPSFNVETDKSLRCLRTQEGLVFHLDEVYLNANNEPANKVGEVRTTEAVEVFSMQFNKSVIDGSPPREEGSRGWWWLVARAHFVISQTREHLASIFQVLPQGMCHYGDTSEAQQAAYASQLEALNKLRDKVISLNFTGMPREHVIAHLKELYISDGGHHAEGREVFSLVFC